MKIKDEDLQDAIEYYKGVRVRLFRYGNKYYTIMNRKCKHYNNKTKLCTRYNTRPKVCRDFPGGEYTPHLVKWCPLMGQMREDGKL